LGFVSAVLDEPGVWPMVEPPVVARRLEPDCVKAAKVTGCLAVDDGD
jgi:hypothetical protein